MPAQYRNKTKGPRPRGVSNRNKGLQWVRENAYNGVLYFADDDNTYDLDLFNEVNLCRCEIVVFIFYISVSKRKNIYIFFNCNFVLFTDQIY